MLYTAKTLKGYALHSHDGNIGSVREFYFDDKFWTVRYLVADTGGWLTGRKVLLSPFSIHSVDSVKKQIRIGLTKKQIENSPGLDTDQPVSRQFEESYYGYYDWPTYWGGPYSWGPNSYVMRDSERFGEFTHREQSWDSHLRSTHAVDGYHISALNGTVGHVEDFIVDDETWAIRYFVVNTRNWIPGKKVLVSPQWIKNISWDDSKVVVGLTREAIKNAPELTDDLLISRNYESELYSHYNHEGYWAQELAKH
jgi:PRC-barrel domain